MDNKLRISVIIVNYNYDQYIGRAIESTLNQTYPNIELIVIDDGSTDDSDTVIKRYVKKHPELKYVHQENKGANKARNKGIELAKGDYIFLLDADNWLDPDHIEKLYKMAQEYDAEVVYSDLQHFGASTERLITPEYDLDYLKVTNYIDTAALVKLKAIGNNRFDLWLNRKFLQDYDFFLGLALKGLRFVKCPDVSLNYRVHENQNGYQQNNISKLQDYIKNYEYIIGKYTKLYPQEFKSVISLANSLQVDIIHLHQEVSQLHQLNQLLQEQLSALSEVNTELRNVYQSLSWRVTRPLRDINVLTKKIRIGRKK